MKRLILSILLVCGITTSLFAQRNAVSGALTISRTEVIKTTKKFKQSDVVKGYQQELSLGGIWDYGGDDGTWRVSLNYLGGYRFNHHLFVGFGTGLDFGATNSFRPFAIEDDSLDNYVYNANSSTGNNRYNYEGQWEDLPVQRVAIPVYLHLRAYFMKTKWAPFLSLSGGVRVSTPKVLNVYIANGSEIVAHNYSERYGIVTGMIEIMPGINYQRRKGLGFNFQMGYAARGGHELDYSSIDNEWSHGVTMRLGVTF